MKLQLGEVVPIRMRFHEAAGAKARPAVVLLDAGDDDFVAAPVTSRSRHCEFDLAIGDWRAAGLNVESSLRLHNLTVLPRIEIVRSVGTLSPPDRGRTRSAAVSSLLPARGRTNT